MDVDAIVIGSGAGGLAAAVALARAGKRVVVLEQHDVPGGWCHSFRLGGHQFSPGVHYLGELGPGGRLRDLYEGLGVADDLTMLELNPDGYDHAIVGQERFDIPKGRDRLEDRLIQRFPKEAEGIRGYLRLVDKLRDELVAGIRVKGPADLLKLPFRVPNLARYGLLSMDRVMNGFTKDPLLKAILAIQAGDHGVGPESAPFAVHASVQAHYFDGAWYPKGGGQAIPKAFLAELKRNKGEIRFSSRVERILVENGPDGPKAIGVKLVDGTGIRAPIVISNADPGITFGRMVDPVWLQSKTVSKLKKTEWSVAGLSLFLAADFDARAAGLDSGNFWYSRTPRIQDGYDFANRSSLDGVAEMPGQFLTVTTLKDPSKGIGTTHTMESFVFVSYEAFKKWAHSKFGDRPQDYAAMKEHLTKRMLGTLDRIVPGLSEKVTFAELGTPLTNEHYCMSTAGNLYGTAKTRGQVGPFGWPVKTEIKGLLMCGASTVSHGVLGAHVSGVFAAASALGVRAEEILAKKSGQMTFLPCDDLTAWPEDLRKRIEGKRAARPARQAAPEATA